MKILLTGVSGVGKTTLAKHLVAEGIVEEHVKENYAWILSADPQTPDGKKILVNRSIEWINEQARKILLPQASLRDGQRPGGSAQSLAELEPRRSWHLAENRQKDAGLLLPS